MKSLFTMALFCLADAAFAQDAKKDTALHVDYGARIYDARVIRYLHVEPKDSLQKDSPYKFAELKKVAADSTTSKLPTNIPKKK